MLPPVLLHARKHPVAEVCNIFFYPQSGHKRMPGWPQIWKCTSNLQQRRLCACRTLVSDEITCMYCVSLYLSYTKLNLTVAHN